MGEKDKGAWQAQIFGNGNNIPKSYLRKFYLSPSEFNQQDELSDELRRFIQDEI